MPSPGLSRSTQDVCSITNWQEVETAAQTAADVNLLINNAGVLASGSLLTSDIGSLRRDIDSNLYLSFSTG